MAATLNGPYGQTVLGPNSLTIGRVAGNQLVVNDLKVSSHHAEIRLDGQGYSIIDLGSTNGTFLNEQRLMPNIPRPLQPGDVIRFGDSSFTYEGGNGYQIEPTVYASPSMGSSPGYPPPLVPPAPPPAPPPPYAAYSDAPYGAVAQAGAYSPPVPPAPITVQKPRRRGLWITLGAVVGVLVIAAIILGALVYINRSTPTKTINAFCDALKSGNYQTAYNQFSTGFQGQVSEAGFAVAFKGGSCKTISVDDSAGTATVTYSFAGGSVLFPQGSTAVYDYTFGDENGSSKIVSQHPHSSSTLTLGLYCAGIKSKDYQTAYNQLSSAIQAKVSEAQFADQFTSYNVNDCQVSNVDNAAGTGKVTYTFSSGAMLTTDETLSTEKGNWKISAVTRVPTETLNAFCSSLVHTDYPRAYAQLSSGQQSQTTETQFAAQFNSTTVTNCTVSNVNDSAGTGTISYTFSDGSTSAIDYTLINENGTWGIDSGKRHA